MLVERNEQLMRVDGWLRDCAMGTGRVVLLEGAIGFGKTAILREVADRTAGTDTISLTATCSPGERDLPFGVLSQLFDSPGLPSGLRQRAASVLRELMVSAAAHSIRETVDRNRAQIHYDLLGPLIDLSADVPIMVGVDDIGHADEASRHCLLHLVRRLGSARILLLLGEQPEPTPVHSPFHAEIVRQPRSVRLPLAPLTLSGVRELLQRRHTEAEDAEDTEERDETVAERFHDLSGGNPLLLHALIEDEAEGGDGPQRAYGRALLGCLYRSDPVMLSVARAMAVHGDDIWPEDLVTLLDTEGDGDTGGDLDPDGDRGADKDRGADGDGGADATTVARALQVMAETGMLRDGRFRHPAIARTVLDDLPTPDRARLHHRCARLLHGRGAPPVAVARHLLRAGEVRDPWASALLLEAAGHASLHGEVRLAVDCLELARRSGTDETARTAIRTKLAQAEWQLNPSASARHLTALTAAARGGGLGLGDTISLIRQLLWLDRAQEANDLLGVVRDTARDPSGDLADEVRDLEMWLACSYPPLAGRLHGGAVPAGPHSAPTAKGADPGLRTVAVLSSGLIHRHSHETRERTTRALGQSDQHYDSPWAEESTLLALLSLIYGGELGAATARCRNADGRRDTTPTPTRQAIYAAVEAEIALRKGDLPTAVERAQTALDLVSARGWGTAVGLPLGCLILAHTRMGNLEVAAELVSQSFPVTLFQSRYGLHYLQARGHYYLATDRTHAALADFLTCGELMRGWGLDLPGIVPWRTSAAEAWLRQNNRDQAKRLVKDQLALPGVNDTVTRGLSLRLLAAFSSPGQRPKLLSEAADIVETAGDTFELARTLADLGRAHHTLGKHRRSRMVMRRAWHVANMCKAAPLCQELLPDVRGFDEGAEPGLTAAIASLTNSERRIASLAVMGYTNREIAEKFFITPSTVEQHLTRVYRKLAIKNRRGLPDCLRADVARRA
ncbi:LuxR C-terminal-related transcriptional regulator [Streptomyces sp. NPDC007983]|uniref:helix-turn-helix transcriptional regulator n=1 Tax=Streptomyces sp. NPDC007983 TaxID=3364800 RepID=UPI0036E00455